MDEGGRSSNQLSLLNICKGAAPEVFEREVSEMMANITDINTVAEQKRTITLEFTFAPFKDRSGAVVTMNCKHKLAGVDPVDGSVFFATDAQGEFKAFSRDPRQVAMFAEAPVQSVKQ